jgi:DNA modification methylase
MATPKCLNVEHGENWTLFNGDSCEVLQGIPSESVGFGIHSPPFANLYIYSDSEADLGNCADNDEFFKHYSYIIKELFRVTISGRICAIHCKDLPKYANRDGTAGLIDFPGMIVRAFEAEGWSYHSRVTIWKCPVVERERTNNNGLLHKTVERDRSQLMFRKPPVGTLMSAQPVTNGGKGFKEWVGDPSHDPSKSELHPSKFARTEILDRESVGIWRRYAEPVWWDIQQTNVLNKDEARDEGDERHICPLQLDVIRRCIEIWSNPGDVVLSPFAGIGSEIYQALLMGRKGIGIELKESYFNTACRNLRRAENESRQADLFANLEEVA